MLSTTSDAFWLSTFPQRCQIIQQKLLSITSTSLKIPTNIRTLINSRTATLLSMSTRIEEDDEYEELLEEMIYSGDFTAFIRKKSKDIITTDFLDFLQEREKSAEDIDDKTVLSEIINIINNKIRLSDGMGGNVESIFEARLDKILYTAPNKRQLYIEENIEDMTDGFIDHVKRQMSTDKDIDNKVVFASILKLISQVKGTDLLGKHAI